ncbi:hypothetical protein B0H12DRAFT_1068723 [Mycena haematopus]|nr:hypothetical protein B0H12DRAFT_1068723 [Mycena haematopus]
MAFSPVSHLYRPAVKMRLPKAPAQCLWVNLPPETQTDEIEGTRLLAAASLRLPRPSMAIGGGCGIRGYKWLFTDLGGGGPFFKPAAASGSRDEKDLLIAEAGLRRANWAATALPSYEARPSTVNPKTGFGRGEQVWSSQHRDWNHWERLGPRNPVVKKGKQRWYRENLKATTVKAYAAQVSFKLSDSSMAATTVMPPWLHMFNSYVHNEGKAATENQAFHLEFHTKQGRQPEQEKLPRWKLARQAHEVHDARKGLIVSFLYFGWRLTRSVSGGLLTRKLARRAGSLWRKKERPVAVWTDQIPLAVGLLLRWRPKQYSARHSGPEATESDTDTERDSEIVEVA